jgi:hypothetical protein
MRGGDRATVEAFEQAVAAIPHLRQAQRLFGEPGYLLRVITADLPAFPGGLGNRLATLPGVQRLSSTRVTKSVVENRPLPLYQNRRPPKGTLERSSINCARHARWWRSRALLRDWLLLGCLNIFGRGFCSGRCG